jgi:hypothetical protein
VQTRSAGRVCGCAAARDDAIRREASSRRPEEGRRIGRG